MKAYRGRTVILTSAPIAVSSHLQILATLIPTPLHTRERTPVPNEQEDGLAPKPVWTSWKTEKSLALTGSRTLDRPCHSIVTIAATLPQKHNIPEKIINNIIKFKTTLSG
jgi:hypothetical protein